MKNKKLFAILTLVCFMFTLMPVAAFAAPINEETGCGYAINDNATKMYFGSVVTGYANLEDTTSPTHLKVTTAGAYYIYAVDSNGNLAELVEGDAAYKQVGKTVLVNATTTDAIKVKFTEAGTYTLHAANYQGTTQAAIIANVDWARSDADVLSFLKGFSKLTMYNNTVTVGTAEAEYTVTVSPAGTTTIKADKGYTSTKVLVEVKKGGYAVPNAEVEVYTNSYGLTVTPLTKVTNAAGQMYALVTATVPGDNFAVYAEYEGVVCATPQVITVTAVGEKEVAVVAEPVAPVDVKTTVGASGIAFKITDGFGNDALSTSPQNYKVTLVSAPAQFMTNDTYTLVAHDTIDGAYKLDAANVDQMKYEGTYTFMVSLQNGASATASVEVKKFDKTVGIMFVKAPTTMAYNTTGSVLGLGVYEVDANGVTRNLSAKTPWTNLSISANGKAIENFTVNTSAGTAVLDPKNVNEDYIGSVVTIMAVYDNGQNVFTATNNITIVDTAATIAYKATTAEVGVNNVLKAQIVDAAGKVTPVTEDADVKVIVLEKPANAVVTATPAVNRIPVAPATSATEFDVNFLASVAGEYKIQTIVTTVAGDEYISGIETITVGAGQATFQDVVVMSINSAKIVVNSSVKDIPAAAVIKDSRTMVPFRALAEAFGATVDYDQASGNITAELNGVKVVMKADQNTFTVNGAVKTADVAPYLNVEASTTMVPVSFVANAFGINYQCIFAEDGTVADVLFTK